ncbi:hypothetical protein CCP1ISM_20025 [Azospirillaceae bacterium]
MDTIGNCIDKLMTVNLKLYYNANNKDINKIINLNDQKKALEHEITNLIDIAISRSDAIQEIDMLRPQHKTY